MTKRTAALLVFLVLTLTVICAWKGHALEPGSDHALISPHQGPYLISQKVEEEEKTKKAKEDYPDYKPYLDKSKELGFSPDARQLKVIHSLVESQFYGKSTQSKLVESTAKELKRLLDAAKIEDTLVSGSYGTPEEFLQAAVDKYGDRINPDLITYAALSGMLKGLDDPYTVYMTPKEYSILMEQMQSASFGGLGIYIELDPDNDKWLTIIETIEGTPAEKAGLRTGDIIAEIEGVSTKGISIDMAVSKLRGPQGSSVTLTIMRKGSNGTRKVAVTREKILVKSVTSKILNNSIGYVKMRLFGNDTSSELNEALQGFQESGVKGIILDLRNNGGGYINAAIDVASAFIENGDSVVKVKDRMGKSLNHTARGDFKCKLPLIILVNKYSASASEITAGAIKDYKRGVLIGTKTFGKGSVQQVIPFPDGSALKVTVSHYYTPSGNDIDKQGLEPDYKIEMEPKDVGKEKDPQLDKAIQVLRGTTKL